MLGALPQAFERRDGEEYLSTTWLEYFATDYQGGLIGAVAAIHRQLKVRSRDGFTVGNVDKIIEVCESFEIRVRILHEPAPPENDGHSAIRGIPRDNLSLLASLADDAFTDTRVATAIAAAEAPGDGA